MGNVVIVANMATKQLIVVEEILTKKENSGSIFQPSDHYKNSSNEQRKPMWMQGDPRRKGNSINQK